MMPEMPRSGDAAVREERPVDGGVDLDIWLPPDHLYFDGHFPDLPILPGAVQIDWAVQLADKYLDAQIGAARRFQVKFRRPIRPGTTVTLVLRLSLERRALTFDYRCDGNVYSNGRISLREER